MKQRFFKIGVLLSVLFIISLLGCSEVIDIDKEIDKGSAESYLKADVSGKKFLAVLNNNSFSIDDIAIEIKESEPFSSFSITAATFDDGAAKAITLFVIFENSFASWKKDTSWNAKDKLQDGETSPIYGIYAQGKPNSEEAGGSSQTTEVASLKISSIDRDKKIISGTFNFTAYDEDNRKTFIITNGIFNKVPYKLK